MKTNVVRGVSYGKPSQYKTLAFILSLLVLVMGYVRADLPVIYPPDSDPKLVGVPKPVPEAPKDRVTDESPTFTFTGFGGSCDLTGTTVAGFNTVYGGTFTDTVNKMKYVVTFEPAYDRNTKPVWLSSSDRLQIDVYDLSAAPGTDPAIWFFNNFSPNWDLECNATYDPIWLLDAKVKAKTKAVINFRG